MVNELLMTASTLCWVNAPVAVFTSTPRSTGSTVRPVLPVPDPPRSPPVGTGGGTGSWRGVATGDVAGADWLPSAAASVTVTTKVLPASSAQPSAFLRVTQSRAGESQVV
jgi:hypothetical protein